MNPMQPSASLLCKLGSIAVHAEEMTSATGHAFDKQAMDTLLQDTEVVAWLAEMNRIAMVPRKRTIEDVRLYAASRKKNVSEGRAARAGNRRGHAA